MTKSIALQCHSGDVESESGSGSADGQLSDERIGICVVKSCSGGEHFRMGEKLPRLVAAAALAVLLQATMVATVFAQSIVEGVWKTKLESEVTIAPCDSVYCGFITKIVVPSDIAAANKDALAQIGTNFFDYNNKDPKLRARPIQGLQILTLHMGKSPSIYDGDIYNPQDGNTYSGYIEVLSPNRLRLNGCILYNIICRGEEWVRVPGEH
jgi:uncharacterized protein (DUF2147 family)